jgi:hypothetical protein
MIKILALEAAGAKWRWRIIENGLVVKESRLSFDTMDEALLFGNAHAESMETRTVQKLGSRLRRKLWRQAS